MSLHDHDRAPLLRAAGLVCVASTLVSVFVLSATSCGSVDSTARIGVSAPDRAQFDAVGKYLDRRCGSIDCHGANTRNLQIFGCEGMRLADADTPRCRATGGKDTTPAELDATYRSLVGLEPVVMSSVVQSKGANPELLTFVRKARGTEAHKGGTLIVPGDDQDICITSWLAGATNVDACDRSSPDAQP
jgi:hypothetical protein